MDYASMDLLDSLGRPTNGPFGFGTRPLSRIGDLTASGGRDGAMVARPTDAHGRPIVASVNTSDRDPNAGHTLQGFSSLRVRSGDTPTTTVVRRVRGHARAAVLLLCCCCCCAPARPFRSRPRPRMPPLFACPLSCSPAGQAIQPGGPRRRVVGPAQAGHRRTAGDGGQCARWAAHSPARRHLVPAATIPRARCHRARRAHRVLLLLGWRRGRGRRQRCRQQRRRRGQGGRPGRWSRRRSGRHRRRESHDARDAQLSPAPPLLRRPNPATR